MTFPKLERDNPMKVSLVISQGSQAGKVIPVTQSFFLIGRHPRCHLRPASPDVSTHHCALFVEERRVLVRDLRSRTGTLVNDQPTSGEVELQAGDKLKVGPLTFIFWQGNQVVAEEAVTSRHTEAPPQDEASDTVAAGILLTEPHESDSRGSPAEIAAPVPVSAKKDDQCDFANYRQPLRKLGAAEPSRAAAAILNEYRYRSRGSGPSSGT